MTMKHMMLTAIGAFAIAATPAIAQMQPSGTQTDPGASTGAMQSGSMQSGSMQNGAMGDSGMKMTAAQTRQMKKCQAMTSDMMAKNKTCAKMMKMHPEMMSSGGM